MLANGNCEPTSEEIVAAADAMSDLWDSVGAQPVVGISWLQLASAALKAARSVRRSTHDGTDSVH